MGAAIYGFVNKHTVLGSHIAKVYDLISGKGAILASVFSLLVSLGFLVFIGVSIRAKSEFSLIHPFIIVLGIFLGYKANHKAVTYFTTEGGSKTKKIKNLLFPWL